MERLKSNYGLHVLQANHSQSRPSFVCYLDVETRQKPEGRSTHHTVKLAWACFSRYVKGKKEIKDYWQSFSDGEAICRFIDSLTFDKRTLYIFGHNVFFDLQASGFFKWFTKWGWELEFHYNEGVTYILSIRKGRKKIKAISTSNYFSGTLGQIGDILGLPKQEVDFDRVSRKKLSEYCRRDVEIVQAAVENYFKFITDHDLGKFSLTKSSQAFNGYRHRYMPRRLFIHDCVESQDLETKSYFGGRVECFFIGEPEGGPFVSLDVNSMYPYIMKNYALPYKLISYRENVSVSTVESLLDKYAAIAEVSLQTDVPIYAIRHDNKLVFPVGSFNAFLGTGGLKEALARGHLKSVKRVSFYLKDVLFSDYVDEFYGLRLKYEKTGNKVYETLCKYLLNCLYGKFGQFVPLESKHFDKTFDGYYRIENYIPATRERFLEYKLFNRVIIVRGRVLGKKSILGIPIHITEYARLILYQIIEQIGRENVLYCDTDSVKIRLKDLERVKWPIAEKTLGSLKVEDQTEYLKIMGLKSYITDRERKIKGIPRKATEISPMTFEFVSFPSQKSHMADRIDDHFVTKKIIRHVTGEYSKGVVLPSGVVKPFSLNIS